MVRRIGLARQTLLHGVLLLAACLLPVAPDERFAPRGDEDPILSIVGTLLWTVGPRFFVLAATAPLLQAWFNRIYPQRSPYPLYALSNAGSMLALLSYPFLVEPLLSLPGQIDVWKGLFVLFAFSCAICAWIAYRRGDRSAAAPIAAEVAPSSFGRRLAWLGWSACGVILFMSVTNQLSASMAAVPFLWVAPLSVYLLTFILAFSGEGWYPRRVALLLLLPAVAGIYLAVAAAIGFDEGFIPLDFSLQFVALVGGLFVLCTICHGELYRLRPAPARLTGFYLTISAGGAVGGIVVGAIAPRLFLLAQELYMGVLLCLALLIAGWFPGRPRWARGAMLAGWVVVVGAAVHQTTGLLENAVEVRRNPYGLLRVAEMPHEDPAWAHRRLFHGATVHGAQFVKRELQRFPTTYFTPAGGGGAVLARFRTDAPRRVGLVGLGVGTLATYGKAGDWFKFYEIDPDVVDLAQSEFTYLANSRARWEVRVGDARLTLAREPPQRFDILVLDAFSGGTIPVHLLTLEAFELYERHLTPGGVIAVHVSNRELDLTPVLYNAADRRGLQVLSVVTKLKNPRFLQLQSKWVLLSADGQALADLIGYFEPRTESGEVSLFRGDPELYTRIRPWTDDYSNLVQLLD